MSFMLSVKNKPSVLSFVMLNVVVLSVKNKPSVLSFVMLNVVVLSAKSKPSAELRYAECRCTGCSGAA